MTQFHTLYEKEFKFDRHSRIINMDYTAPVNSNQIDSSANPASGGYGEWEEIKPSVVTLDQCLGNIKKSTILDGDTAYECHECNKKTRANK